MEDYERNDRVLDHVERAFMADPENVDKKIKYVNQLLRAGKIPNHYMEMCATLGDELAQTIFPDYSGEESLDGIEDTVLLIKISIHCHHKIYPTIIKRNHGWRLPIIDRGMNVVYEWLKDPNPSRFLDKWQCESLNANGYYGEMLKIAQSPMGLIRIWKYNWAPEFLYQQQNFLLQILKKTARFKSVEAGTLLLDGILGGIKRECPNEKVARASERV